VRGLVFPRFSGRVAGALVLGGLSVDRGSAIGRWREAIRPEQESWNNA
jgi:hypothetical protein